MQTTSAAGQGDNTLALSKVIEEAKKALLDCEDEEVEELAPKLLKPQHTPAQKSLASSRGAILEEDQQEATDQNVGEDLLLHEPSSEADEHKQSPLAQALQQNANQIMMNKTLSLIEEDTEEENSQQQMMSLGGSQKIIIEDTLKDLSLQGSPVDGEEPLK